MSSLGAYLTSITAKRGASAEEGGGAGDMALLRDRVRALEESFATWTEEQRQSHVAAQARSRGDGVRISALCGDAAAFRAEIDEVRSGMGDMAQQVREAAARMDDMSSRIALNAVEAENRTAKHTMRIQAVGDHAQDLAARLAKVDKYHEQRIEREGERNRGLRGHMRVPFVSMT